MVVPLFESFDVSVANQSPLIAVVASAAKRSPLHRRAFVSSIDALLPALWLPLGCGFVAAFLYAIYGRLSYPYPVEWLEPATLDIVSRILSGLPIFCEPSVAYVASMKAPLYYYVVAAPALLFGNDLAVARSVSIAASLGACWLIWGFVRREGGSRIWAAFGVMFFLATYRISGTWYDMGRLDSLFLLLTLAGAFVLRFSRGTMTAFAAGLLFSAAFFTKQATLFLVIPTLLLYAAFERRRATLAAATMAGVVVAGMIAMHIASDGWSTFFLVDVPSHVVIDADRIAGFWPSDLLAHLFPAVLTAIGLVAYTRKSARPASLFYGAMLIGAVAAGWAGRANAAGGPNVLIPLFAVLAITMPLALHAASQALKGRGTAARFALIGIHLIALTQLGLLLYNPRSTIPTPSDRARADQLVAQLRAIDGPILIMDDRYFAHLLGNGSVGLDYALTDVLHDEKSRVTAKVESLIIDALRSGQFVGVVDPPPFILDAVTLGTPVSLQVMPSHEPPRPPHFSVYYPIAR
jgi:4-amino-4-deoxy-L-arabinose transferase-like glycosyltransferase